MKASAGSNPVPSSQGEKMETIQENPKVVVWHGMWLVKVSEVGVEFSKWLYGQTMPLVTESDTPTDFAYYPDYIRWKNHLPVID